MSERTSRRVGLVGPVPPFRGGIAQHTMLLGRALDEVCDLRVISFERQYPVWLFPGESDRDPALEGHVEPGTDYLIDSMDPRTWRRALSELRSWGADTVVMPWWTIFWAPCFGYLARGLRRAGIEVVFMCHNVIEHEAAPWKTALTARVLRSGDRFVTHTLSDARRLTELVPGAEVGMCPHPVYEGFPDPSEELPKRADLELLFFGFIRPYKGLPVLLDAMPMLADLDVMLSVVGESWEDMSRIVDGVARAGMADRVEFVTRYVSDVEAANYFTRADLVVLPYRSATGSGVIPCAYRYGKPVVVTDVGGLPDVVQDQESGYIVPADDPAAVAGAIRAFADRSDRDMSEGIMRVSANMTWERLAAAALGDGA
ncbi:MAG: glycosyltransferase [Actinomycetota bacterium]|jgi:glycosyltransferase involved in cell wall biosynthesis|nr:glycosyltransferase [Actinomycetota bacterium]